MNEEGTNDLVVVHIVLAKNVDEPAPGSLEVVVERYCDQRKIVLVEGTGAIESFLEYAWDVAGVMFTKIPRDKFKLKVRRPLTIEMLLEESLSESKFESKPKSEIEYIDSRY
jgi:hypothetical protein